MKEAIVQITSKYNCNISLFAFTQFFTLVRSSTVGCSFDKKQNEKKSKKRFKREKESETETETCRHTCR
jgi:hypothetical protein